VPELSCDGFAVPLDGYLSPRPRHPYVRVGRAGSRGCPSPATRNSARSRTASTVCSLAKRQAPDRSRSCAGEEKMRWHAAACVAASADKKEDLHA
jgi:hypothetical protein